MYALIRPLLFRLDPETAHRLTLKSLAVGGPLLSRTLPKAAVCPKEVMGMLFPNPVGLAAGMDKNGEAIGGLAALGLGFIEVGTVTPRPQPGNSRPRLFRLPEAQAIINRMGFNNAGVDALVENVRRSSYRGILGINIGKNFDTPVERAAEDYVLCLRKVYPHASYVAVNISSPNTANLRDLQGPEALGDLIGRLKAEREKLADAHGRRIPLAVKVAPDLDAEQIRAMAEVLRAQRVDAVIATNTTVSREGVTGLPHGQEAGGLSGRPLREKSTAILRAFRDALAGEIPLIGVGGISSGEDAQEKLRAGASLVQLYTGLIYRGPALISECVAAACAVTAGPDGEI
jgi:dihydroorotate dehydrogenase